MAILLPTGIVTLLFSEVEGSTELLERIGDRFHAVLEPHNEILRQAVERWNGYEVKGVGDAFFLAFARASDAVEFAIEVQRMLAEHPWPEEAGELRVRMGMHTGEPIVGQGIEGKPDYFGPEVNRASRIAAAGHGGQILLSAAARALALASLPPEVELVDLGEHRLKGFERPERIFQVNHPALPSRDFARLKTLDSLVHNLPVQLTPFVGRENELGEVVQILKREEIRLLTIVGFGGIGKTRLALQAAAEVVEQFPDGVWFVELEQAREPDEALSAIAAGLRLSLQQSLDAKRQVLGFLTDKDLLLVLDTFEQLSGAGALAADILKAAPRTKCLFTSRAVLGVRGETVYELRSLPTPPASLAAGRVGRFAEQLARYDSVALFVERAQVVNSEWRLTEENAPTVAELCRRLEGLPLVLELAAARMRSMTPEDILRNLNNRFRLLAARASDLPERQRTLRGAIDWSYDLLSEDEKVFLAQLSVFAGGFRAEAAEEVTGNFDALDLVLDLRDKSVLVAREIGGTIRYSMLEVVREYAAEKLQGLAEEARQVRSRHTAYFVRFAEERANMERRPEESQALAETNEELDNLRAAMDWAAENDDEVCARLSLALSGFLSRRGFWQEALTRAQTGCVAAERVGARGLLARLQLNVASACSDSYDLVSARVRADESLRLAKETREADTEAAALNLLGILAYEENREAEAEAYLQESLQLRRSLGDRAGEAMCVHNLARLAQKQERADQATALYEQALALQLEIRDLRGIAQTRSNLGVMAQDRQEYAAAKDDYRECLRIWSGLGDRSGMALALHNLGEVATAEGDLERALPLLAAAAHTFDSIGSPFAAASEAFLESLRERPEAQPFTERLQAARQMELDEVLAAIGMGVEAAKRDGPPGKDREQFYRLLLSAYAARTLHDIARFAGKLRLMDMGPVSAPASLGERFGVLQDLQRTVDALWKYQQVGDLPSRLAYLTRALGELERFGKVGGEVLSPSEKGLLPGIVTTWRSIVDRELNALRAGTGLECSLVARQISRSDRVVVGLRVRNRGGEPAEDIGIQLLSGSGYIADEQPREVPFLAVGQSVEVLFRARYEAGERLRFRFHVRFRYLDGVDRSTTFTDEATLIEERPFLPAPNPYIPRVPLAPDSPLFRGRAETFAFLKRHLVSASTQRHVVLFGERRVGKTSIVKRLNRELPDTHISCYLDLHGIGSEGLPNFLCTLARSMSDSLSAVSPPIHVSPPDLTRLERRAEWFEEEFLRQVCEKLDSRHFVLVLDEYEYLLTLVRAARKLPETVFGYLRHLMQEFPRISFVLAGAYELEDLEDKHWQSFTNLAVPHRVELLSEEDTRWLIVEPVAQAGRIYDDLAIAYVARLAGGHPSFLQSICSHLVNYRNETTRLTLGYDDVARCLDGLLEEAEDVLKEMWELRSSPRERILLSILAEQECQGRKALLAEVIELLRKRFPTAESAEGYGVFRRLAERQLVHVAALALEPEPCTFRVGLFREWLVRHKANAIVQEGLQW